MPRSDVSANRIRKKKTSRKPTVQGLVLSKHRKPSYSFPEEWVACSIPAQIYRVLVLRIIFLIISLRRKFCIVLLVCEQKTYVYQQYTWVD